jgi:hypothetical protein
VKNILLLSLLAGTLAAFGTEEKKLYEAGTVEGGTWRLVEEPERGTIIELSESGEVPTYPVRRPANILWLTETESLPFSFQVDAKSLAPKVKGADVCIILGDEDGKQMVYAHLSNDSDGRVHQVIMHVDLEAGKRKTIQTPERPKTSLAEGWNRFWIHVNPEGELFVYSDSYSADTPIMTALLPQMNVSKLGIGSFNDPAQFDEVHVEFE